MSLNHIVQGGSGPLLDLQANDMQMVTMQLTAGANAGNILTTDGSGNASWSPPSGILPQPLGPTDDVTFNSVTLTALPPLAMVSSDASSKLVGTQLSNGQLMIGSTAAAPVAASLSSSNANISFLTGAGVLAIDFATSPSFSSVSLTTGAVNGNVLTSDGAGLGSWQAPAMSHLYLYSLTGGQALGLAGAPVALASDNDLFLDPAGDINNEGAGTYRFVNSGTYIVNFNVTQNTGANGGTLTLYSFNGDTSEAYGRNISGASAASKANASSTGYINASAGQSLLFFVIPDAITAGETVGVGPNETSFMSIQRVR